jgi:hypothetical protein
VDSVFRFEQAGEAHRRIQSRQSVGKVVLALEVRTFGDEERREASQGK